MMMMQQQDQATRTVLGKAWPDPPPRIQAAMAGLTMQSAAEDKELSKRSNPSSESSPALVVERCPRCNSLNTKFCYYNNYSLSQPRHFCKDCRRYWTKGGTLRNVPVGGGCRKNKRSTLVKDRPADTLGSLVNLDGSTAKILTSINNINSMSYKGEGNLIPYSSALPLSNLPNGSIKEYTPALTLSQLQESMKLMTGEESSQSTLFKVEQEIASPLFTSLFTSPFSPSISNLNPSSLSIQWNSPQGQGPHEMFQEAELMRAHPCLLSSHAVSLGASPPVTPTLEDHASLFSGSSPTESSTVEKVPCGSLSLQVGAEQHLDNRRHALTSSSCMNEEEITSDIAFVGGGAIPLPTEFPNIYSLADREWGQVSAAENVFGTSEPNLWTATWSDMQAALAGAGSTIITGALLH